MRPCPKCNYDLTGLPEAYVCPECGLEYDPHAISIRSGGRRKRSIGLILGVLCFFLGFRGLRFTLGADLGDWPFALYLVLGLGMFVHEVSRLGNAAKMILLNRSGLTIVRHKADATFIPWERIRGAEVSWITGALVISGQDGMVIVRVGYPELGGLRRSRRYRDEINHLKAEYANYEP